MIGAALGAVSLAMKYGPALIDFISGNGDREKQVMDIAREVVGLPSATVEEIDAKLEANPELQVQLKLGLADIGLQYAKEDTKRMEIVNNTMIAEIAGKGLFKTGWRPFMGWGFSFCYLSYVFSLTVIVIWAGYELCKKGLFVTAIDKMIETAVAMKELWFVALLVLGVVAVKRSDDKRNAAGLPSILGSVMKFIKK